MLFTSRLFVAGALTRGLACCAVLFGGAGLASAQPGVPLNTLADEFLMRDGWTYTPILQSQPNSVSSRCVALFAARNEAEVSATAINAVLYNRGAGCDWTAVAWDSADPAEAVKYTKVMLGIDDDQDGKWGVVTAEKLAAANFPDPPAAYDKGMFVSDPLYGVVRDDIDRDAIIETLEEWGFNVAKISLESKSPDECYFSSELCRIAEMAEVCGTLGPMGMVQAAIDEMFEAEEDCGPPRTRPLPRYLCDTWVYEATERDARVCVPSIPVCPGTSPFATCPMVALSGTGCTSRSQSGQPGSPTVWDCKYQRCYSVSLRRTTMWTCTDRHAGVTTTGMYYDYRVTLVCQKGEALGCAAPTVFPTCTFSAQHRWYTEGESLPRSPWAPTPPAGHPDSTLPLPPRNLPPEQEWEWPE